MRDTRITPQLNDTVTQTFPGQVHEVATQLSARLDTLYEHDLLPFLEEMTGGHGHGTAQSEGDSEGQVHTHTLCLPHSVSLFSPPPLTHTHMCVRDSIHIHTHAQAVLRAALKETLAVLVNSKGLLPSEVRWVLQGAGQPGDDGVVGRYILKSQLDS